MIEEDFKTLATNGNRFEALVHELLKALGYRIVSRPAVGVDGGKDLLIEREVGGPIHKWNELVVVQCKHYATSENAVAESNVGEWFNAMVRNHAKGYLLVTDTRVTVNLRDAFEAFTNDPSHQGRWAKFWDVDDLIRLLQSFPEVRRAFFPDKTLEIDPPPLVGGLIKQLGQLARQSDNAFDQGNWKEFADCVAETRKSLIEMARHQAQEHFTLFYHVKRSNEFPRLQELLSTQQLAYERMDEARVVEHIVALKKAPKSFDHFATALGKLDAFRESTFELTRKEASWLTGFAPAPKNLVMVGCGALPYTLLHACWKTPSLSCTGLDYDNGSLVLAHKVRECLGLEGRIHYITQNGHMFDYHDHDLIVVANIVSPKHRVLERITATAPRGAVIVVRNPVTFGELLWEDARYTYLNGLELAGRFDAKPFDQCFETVVLRKCW